MKKRGRRYNSTFIIQHITFPKALLPLFHQQLMDQAM